MMLELKNVLDLLNHNIQDNNSNNNNSNYVLPIARRVMQLKKHWNSQAVVKITYCIAAQSLLVLSH